jgi:iron complex outermembrane receptor protein
LSLGEFHQFRGSMTQAAYRFDREGQSFRIPGVAERTAQLGWQFDNKRWQVGLQTFYQGALYADDLHNALVPDYTLVELNLGHEFSLLGTQSKLAIRIQNLTNTSYFDNIRINAFGKRYYEPAAGRQFFVRLACAF